MIRPGAAYVTKSGDTLRTIASEAYGDSSLWTRIAEANKPVLDPETYGPVAVAPGETLFIPELPELKRSLPAVNSMGDLDEALMFVQIQNRAPTILQGKIYTSIDTMSDTWEIIMPWNIGEDSTLDRLTRPFQYPKAKAGIGSETLVSGLLFDVQPRFTRLGRLKTLRGFSYAKNAVDSNVREPYQYRKTTLEDIVRSQTQHYNINVSVDAGVDTGGTFNRVVAGKGQKVFDFLIGLAVQRGVLITSTRTGDLRIIKPAVTGSVGTLEEGVSPQVREEGWSAAFSGQTRFRTYTVLGRSPRQRGKQTSITDRNIPVPRFQTFQANDTTAGNIQQALLWRRSKAVADAMSFRLPVEGWYAPNGQLWRKNTILTIISPTIFVPDGYDFLINSVEYSVSVSGKTVVLGLVPPQVYTKEEVEEPWL